MIPILFVQMAAGRTALSAFSGGRRSGRVDKWAGIREKHIGVHRWKPINRDPTKTIAYGFKGPVMRFKASTQVSTFKAPTSRQRSRIHVQRLPGQSAQSSIDRRAAAGHRRRTTTRSFRPPASGTGFSQV